MYTHAFAQLRLFLIIILSRVPELSTSRLVTYTLLKYLQRFKLLCPLLQPLATLMTCIFAVRGLFQLQLTLFLVDIIIPSFSMYMAHFN